MIIEQIDAIISRISGCTFASVDSETKTNGLRKVTTNERVILFSTKAGSGYERMVKRRLVEANKDPESFVVGDLPWGERIPGTPLIKHKGFVYLQMIIMAPGLSKYFLGTKEIPDHMLKSFGVRERLLSQGLAPDRQVKVHCVAIENITGIRLLGENLVDEEAPRPRRKKLGLF